MTIYRAASIGKVCQSPNPKDAEIFKFCKRNNIFLLCYKEYRNLYYSLAVEDINRLAGGREIADRNEFLKIALATAREDDAVETGGKFSFRGIDPALANAHNSTSWRENGCPRFSDFIRARLDSGVALSAIVRKALGGNPSKALWDSICKASYIVDTLADLKKDMAAGIVKHVRLRDFATLLAELARCAYRAAKEIGFSQALRELLPSTLILISGGIHSDESNKERFEIAPRAMKAAKRIPIQSQV